MSTFNEIDITCESCGEEFKGTVWTAVHATQDPELKEILLGGELNLIMCPKCSHVAYQDHFVLYQDPAAEIVAYIYPPVQERDADFLRKTMMESFNEAQKVYKPQERKNYAPLLIFGLETFVEMMREETERGEQSQIALEICSRENIPYQLLRPSEARQQKTMRVIPGKSRENSDVKAGIEKLLAINPALDRYAKLAKTL